MPSMHFYVYNECPERLIATTTFTDNRSHVGRKARLTGTDEKSSIRKANWRCNDLKAWRSFVWITSSRLLGGFIRHSFLIGNHTSAC